MLRKRNISRREFLGGATAAIVVATDFPYFIPASALGKDGRAAPSERVVVGLIGHGSWEHKISGFRAHSGKNCLREKNLDCSGRFL